ncbi:ABC-type transport system, involved in lipoprotein release, permease component [Microbacterium sp. cf046]|uniref:ABC transporter permease n=1 Tax=Microbacterium sp. cf046 TaxID=1761803 RepID=UPI0008E76F7C|nr:ABC transporter permease [Microbacterium sp. cf046]SFS08939.1 ABC-type transport system, involved in lipoprotein release, permease component [Microbacterium sp. cf046]
MYWTYLRRELVGRKKQTIIVAAGLAIAIALVIVVNSLAAGVRDAQAQALESVYGVGTDLTVSGAMAEPGADGAPQFQFDESDGQTADGTTSLSQSRLMTDRMRGTLDSSTLETISAIDGVAAASGALALTNTTFSGELPEPGTAPEAAPAPEDGSSDTGQPQRSFGGGDFDVDAFSVLGIDPAETAVGPLSAVTLSEGRGLDSDDAGQNVAVLDATYASSSDLGVGDMIDVGGTDMEIVGIVASASSDADTAANVYIPLDVAQALAGVEDVVSTVYVQAESADAIAAVQADIEAALPDATVSSQSELASTVSGSLSSASALISNLGTWLSIIVLAVALGLAVLFTISGVSRRTREFGTLKAIGWSNGRVVGQVAGESVAQGLLGGAVGLALGLAGIWVINLISPTISTAPSAVTVGGPGGGTVTDAGPGGGGPGFGGLVQQSGATDVVLNAPLTLWVIVAAIVISIAGGLIAGAFGGWRAARLSPAEALRSVG